MKIRAEGAKISNRKERANKKKRIQTYVSPELGDKINRLARTCDTTESELIAKVMDYLCSTANFVNWIQDIHRVERDDPFRIIPHVENGKAKF